MSPEKLLQEIYGTPIVSSSTPQPEFEQSFRKEFADTGFYDFICIYEKKPRQKAGLQAFFTAIESANPSHTGDQQNSRGQQDHRGRLGDLWVVSGKNTIEPVLPVEAPAIIRMPPLGIETK